MPHMHPLYYPSFYDLMSSYGFGHSQIPNPFFKPGPQQRGQPFPHLSMSHNPHPTHPAMPPPKPPLHTATPSSHNPRPFVQDTRLHSKAAPPKRPSPPRAKKPVPVRREKEIIVIDSDN